MCGIVGAVAQRQVQPILLEGLLRLEYRGYDSAGMSVLDDANILHRRRCKGKVIGLANLLEEAPLSGSLGIAHTRWATHGAPSEKNAHPHQSHDTVSVVHNGIIENFEALRKNLQSKGYECASDTDTEVVAHLFHNYVEETGDLIAAAVKLAKELDGAFALGLIHRDHPGKLMAIRHRSPLLIGVGIGEHFIASDVLALLPVTQRFIYLEENDIAEITHDAVSIYDGEGQAVERAEHETALSSTMAERGQYRHFMRKEIDEQPEAINATLANALNGNDLLPHCFGRDTQLCFSDVQRLHLIACGTSYHAALAARYWIEAEVGLPCHVEVASEFRYRQAALEPNTLLVTLSQSGETADTLAVLRKAKQENYLASLAICNVAESNLVRESDGHFLTQAGPEQGVAATKTFTTQLVALRLLVFALLQAKGQAVSSETIQALRQLPELMQEALSLEPAIKNMAQELVNQNDILFLGRGALFPIALEGALKLKELSYLHAEGYPAGELKHGPLALVDETMPVISLLPNDALLPKLCANLEEVRARGGQLFVFADQSVELSADIHRIALPSVSSELSPILYSLPLQLLAYHVAVLKGTDVDQPRNLAKSVTVE